jgi:predicted esterase
MMKKVTYLTILLVFIFVACSNDTVIDPNNGNPLVNIDSSFSVWQDQDLIYAEGLSHDETSSYPSLSYAKPLLLDIYVPDNTSTNRPVFMFIHGGGFKGGTKTKPEIIDMANYYASRGWVFVSIDYRTTEELGKITQNGMTSQEILSFYKGIAPPEWINFAMAGAETPKEFQQSIAMYATQRDAKAALRWIVANSTVYGINTDFITVGGASAGAITAIALGITNQEDFKDEIPLTDDPTLASTHYEIDYQVKSMVYFWGSNVKLDLFEEVFGINPYDANDPELFMAHGTEYDPVTPYEEAIELKNIYDSLGTYSELATLNGFGHGAWEATVDGKGLSKLSFDFIIERQKLRVQ